MAGPMAFRWHVYFGEAVLALTLFRVVWGLGLTIANFSPARAFNSVDFPAFGRPRIQANPERKAILD